MSAILRTECVRPAARIILFAATFALAFLSGSQSIRTVAAQVASTNATTLQSRPVEQMHNADAPPNLNTGWGGARDPRGIISVLASTARSTTIPPRLPRTRSERPDKMKGVIENDC
jgi:hypothetical protein